MGENLILLKRLLIDYQKFSEQLCLDSNVIQSNIEAIACTNQQTMILVDHRDQTFSIYNYNAELYSVVGDDYNRIDIEQVHTYLQPLDKSIIARYIDIVNEQFLSNHSDEKQYTYFTISHSWNTIKFDYAVLFKIIPYLYTSDMKLQATLCIIEPVLHAGCPILKRYHALDSKVEVYSNSIKDFIDEEDVELSSVECEVIRMSGKGWKEQEIADSLSISFSTLKRMKVGIFDKLKVNSISEAIFVAFKKGCI